MIAATARDQRARSSFSASALFSECLRGAACSVKTSGGPLSALTCCVNARLLSAIKKISPLIYSQSWVGSWVYTTHYDDFHPDILARMYT